MIWGGGKWNSNRKSLLNINLNHESEIEIKPRIATQKKKFFEKKSTMKLYVIVIK